MHLVVHVCPFLWGLCAGAHANQAKRFPSNAHFFGLEAVKCKSTWGNIIRMKILTICLYTTLPLWPQCQNKKSGVTGRKRPVKLGLFLRVHRGRKASSRYIKREGQESTRALSDPCYATWAVEWFPFIRFPFHWKVISYLLKDDMICTQCHTGLKQVHAW